MKKIKDVSRRKVVMKSTDQQCYCFFYEEYFKFPLFWLNPMGGGGKNPSETLRGVLHLLPQFYAYDHAAVVAGRTVYVSEGMRSE